MLFKNLKKQKTKNHMGNQPTMDEINLWLTWPLQYFFFSKSSLYFTYTIHFSFHCLFFPLSSKLDFEYQSL